MSDNHENLKETLHEAHKERVQEREELKKGARETRKEIKEMRKKKLSFKELLKVTFSLSEDNASPEEVRDRILSGGKVTGQNAFMLMLAILIASVGLNTNSTAIIIGAMLISPLMGSILALAYGTVVRDGAIIRRYGMGLITQIVILDGAGFILEGYKIRRVGAYQVYFHISKKRSVNIRVSAVPADNPMPAEFPDISWAAEAWLF